MTDWKEIELGDSIEFLNGFAFKSRFFSDDKSGLVLVKGENLGKGRILWDSSKYWDKNDEVKFDKYILKENDIVLAMDRPWVGGGLKYAYISKNDPKSLLVQRVCCLRAKDNFYQAFIRYVIASEDFALYLKNIMGGVAVPHISPAQIKSFKFLSPSLAIQHRIAAILSAYDNLIENNLKRIKLLEEFALRTYEEWFIKFRVNGVLLEVNTNTGLPEGWRINKLNQVASINKSSLRKEFVGKIKYVDISSVSTGNIDSYADYEFEEAPGRARRIVRHGDIIWSCVRPNRKSYSIIWHPEENLIVSTGFVVISPITLPTSYLFQFLTTSAFVNYLTNLATGATYPAVTSEVFADADVTIPTAHLIEAFDKFIKPTIQQVSNLKRKNAYLKESRDILLPRLMNGLTEVDQIVDKPETKIFQPKAAPHGEVTPEFKEAILIAILTAKFGSKQYPLGRMRYTKLSYLYHRYADNKIQDYLRKAAGPYNPKTKYGGPEKIAHKNGYIIDHQNGKLKGFIAGPNVEKAETFFRHYWSIGDLNWLETQFKYKSNDDLELFATVDNAMLELHKKNKPITVTGVKKILQNEPEWKAKLKRDIFSDGNLQRAITTLPNLYQY